MESKRRRQQRRYSELLARIAMNQLADVHRRLNESNPEPDTPMGQLWDVMPKPARDFQSAVSPMMRVSMSPSEAMTPSARILTAFQSLD